MVTGINFVLFIKSMSIGQCIREDGWKILGSLCHLLFQCSDANKNMFWQACFHLNKITGISRKSKRDVEYPSLLSSGRPVLDIQDLSGPKPPETCTVDNNSDDDLLRRKCEVRTCSFVYSTSRDFVRLEVSTAVTMQNGVYWDVAPCGSCKNRRFGGTWRLLHEGDKNRWTRNKVSSNY
jgi:hypothetical protein